MKYITRELERKFRQMDKFFKVVLVTGARQVGKTTMLRHLAEGTERTYPQVQTADEEMRQAYYSSYVDTYLMRDVTEVGGITDSAKFMRFLKACAALTAEQVNYKTLASTADISEPTAKNWIRVLEGLGIVYLLQPYSNNELKRLAKTPKLYFCDTGLAAYLSMWLTRDTLIGQKI